jgi:hypothetical protein
MHDATLPEPGPHPYDTPWQLPKKSCSDQAHNMMQQIVEKQQTELPDKPVTIYRSVMLTIEPKTRKSWLQTIQGSKLG